MVFSLAFVMLTKQNPNHICRTLVGPQIPTLHFTDVPMTELTFEAAQLDMRRGYLCGAPGVLASGLVWLTAGLVAALNSDKAAVFALLMGGAAIHPIGVVIAKLLGRSGTHTPGNPLARLAAENTFWLLAGCAIAYGMHVLRIEWFFPVMLLTIGGRYLTFQTIYGLRSFWFCGALLGMSGLTLALVRAPVVVGAFTGAIIEIVFAVILFWWSKRVAA
jgi:hypothetical protein